MSIRLRQLHIFKAIVDNGSVSAAASALGLTQSALSKSLAGFEDELGFQLFDRIGRRLSLSEQGRLFLERTDTALELLEGIQAAATEIRDNQAAPVRVTAIGPLLMSAYLPRVLSRCGKAFPDLRLSVQTKSRAEIEDWISNGHGDVGFTLLPVQRGRVQARSVARVRAVAILPRDHPLTSLDVLTPRDLHEEKLVISGPSVRLRNLVEADFIQQGIQLRPWVETSNAVSTASLVAEGNGVAVIDPFTPTGFAPDTLAVRRWEPGISLDYGLIWAGKRPLSRYEQSLFDAAMVVAEDMAKTLPWFELT